MASEGGGAGPSSNAEDNPFSFKTFVKRTGGDGESKASRRREGGKKSKRAQDVGSGVPFPEEGGDNPFSFKQFVRKQTKTGDNEATSSSSDSDYSLTNSLDPPSHNDHPLPQPSTGPTVTSIRPKTRGKSSKTVSSSSSSSVKPSQSFPAKLSNIAQPKPVGKNVKRERDSLFDDDSDSDSFTSTSQDTSLRLPATTITTVIDSHHPPPPTTTDLLGLLDEGQRGRKAGRDVDILRLSDTSDEEEEEEGGGKKVAGSRGQITSFLSTTDTSQSERLLKQQCSQLSTENKQLKEELERAKEKFKKEKHKTSKLREQLQTLKQKEAEETKALEDMVAKVEENLVTSTKRAVSAEATISLLTQELQSLKVQLSQADAQSVHRQYEETLSGVRDKANYASRQLSMAAMAADQSIRDLMSGVDTLKNVAEILQLIDRISQVKQH